MLVNEINEKIKVAAVFEGSRVFPKWFYWGKHKHVIEKVEHSWRGKSGDTQLIYFSVTDGANVFEICLNQRTLEWLLEKVYQEG